MVDSAVVTAPCAAVICHPIMPCFLHTHTHTHTHTHKNNIGGVLPSFNEQLVRKVAVLLVPFEHGFPAAGALIPSGWTDLKQAAKAPK
jgi:hypothetical protein